MQQSTDSVIAEIRESFTTKLGALVAFKDSAEYHIHGNTTYSPCKIACWRILDYCDWLQTGEVPSWYTGKPVTVELLRSEAKTWTISINNLINGE